jgi:hypothetical protein
MKARYVESIGDLSLVKDGRPLRILITSRICRSHSTGGYGRKRRPWPGPGAVSVICPKGSNAQKSYEFVDGVHIHRHGMPFEAKRASGYPLNMAGRWLANFS